MANEMYTAEATRTTPALIIYLLDVSGSMRAPIRSTDPKITTRIQALAAALESAKNEMISRSTKGTLISPRYRVAMLAYSDDVYQVGKIQTIDQAARLPTPPLKTIDQTHTQKAFIEVLKLLKQEQKNYPSGSPAPLVCHLTDGEYTKTSGDPEDIVNEIKSLPFPDGNVLVENIYISDDLFLGSSNISSWPGLKPDDNPGNDYAKKLLRLSSLLPEKFRCHMNDNGTSLESGTVMMYPGLNAEFVQMAFVMSTMTAEGKYESDSLESQG